MNFNSGTLAQLEPVEDISRKMKRNFHSQRSGGSFVQLLKKPTKYIESARNYISGDPSSYIDWKIYARNDNLIIREHKEESSTTVGITLDLTESMLWPSNDETKRLNKVLPSKFELASRIAFNLAHNHVTSGDRVDLLVQKNSEQFLLRLKSTADILSLFYEMLKSGFDENLLFNYTSSIEEYGNQKYRIKYFMSDLIDSNLPKREEHTIYHFVIHTLSSLENNISWVKSSNKYLDSAYSRTEFDGHAIKEGYNQKIADWKKTLGDKAKENGQIIVSVDDLMSSSSFHDELMESVL